MMLEEVGSDGYSAHSQEFSQCPRIRRSSLMSSITLLVLVCAMPGAAFGQKNLTVLNAFPGDKGPGTKALPDNVGGVSENHVVDFTSANFVVHDKKTGKVLLEKSQTAFWKDLGFA